VDNVFPALNAILYVFLLMIAVAVAIFLYIRFTLKPALSKNKKKKTEKLSKSLNEFNAPGSYAGNLNNANANLMFNPNPINNAYNQDMELETDDSGKNGKKKNKIKKRKKSKRLLLIIIIVGILIIGAAAYLFIFQRDLIMPLLFGENYEAENVDTTNSSDTTEAAAEADTEGNPSNPPVDNTPTDIIPDNIAEEMPVEPADEILDEAA